MIISLIIAGLIFCGASVFCFYKANYCACTQAGQCDNPVNHYWLGAMLNALVSLALCCIALHVELGTLIWLTLMGSCFLGAFISAKQSKKRQCSKTNSANALLTSETN
ncbi:MULTISPECIES: hypothetical protein [Pseudoalteromonas]|uniref:Uncharacterized protein n=1 Tax=Pseudoalteromonas carrageenovora IAM 12662 TaxID=1314868 RepID=A0ABR9EL93_PSEVC|nr:MULTISPECIES: hypothetical protein [Pseudoalteromonas]KTF14658.1 hypothetical protein ATS74_18395 [Pseudoalteromonas sp. H103]MBE0380760.1 hypothetical protein [Pseudoalteromonas carrageenovora IAM 12662]MCQ8890718.1 hypothetical protein [Pseudoalteromonas carrageenovora]MDO6466340.1 hypothetical protein [Pseudoalteromonas carrageenovora]MDO6548783.1 hypothetical protein [Pseudoalteromonas carrageenovora]